MADMKTVIAKLASNLADEVVAAVRCMSLAELAGLRAVPRHRGSGRPRPKHMAAKARRAHKRYRRSPAQLKKVADQIVAVVKAHPKGINAEAIKTKMGIKLGNVRAKVFSKPLAVALASKEITKKGKRRATMYFAT